MLEQFLRQERNGLKVPSGKKRERVGQKMHQNWSGLIPIADIKMIKNKFGTSFTAVIASVIAGTIRNLMKSMGRNVPQIITAISPAPVPNHPGGLSNHL